MKRSLTAMLIFLGLGCAVAWLSRPGPAPAPAPAVTGLPLDGSQDVRPVAGLRPLPESEAERQKLAALAPLPRPRDTYRSVGFEQLSGFEYRLDQRGRPAVPGQVPPGVEQLNGQLVGLSGYMLPVSADTEGVTAFVLVKNQLFCCYGQTPRVHEWVWVEMQSPVQVLTDRPICVWGRLRVAEEMEGGRLKSLYRLDGRELEAL